MRHKERLLFALLAVMLPLGGALHAGSEPEDPGPTFVVYGIIEGPDPIPQGCNPPNDPDAEPGVGVTPLDQGPDIDMLPRTRYPVMVWAEASGNDRDIAFNEWNGSGWAVAPVYLTAGLGDELGPRIRVAPDGTLLVVWWDSTERVYLARRPADSEIWSAPTLILNPARRPSIALQGDRILVAFERDRVSVAGQEVVVATLRPDGEWDTTVVATTARTGRLDVRLHSDGRHVWLEWTHGENLLAVSEYRDGAWVAPENRVRFAGAGGSVRVR